MARDKSLQTNLRKRSHTFRDEEKLLPRTPYPTERSLEFHSRKHNFLHVNILFHKHLLSRKASPQTRFSETKRNSRLSFVLTGHVHVSPSPLLRTSGSSHAVRGLHFEQLVRARLRERFAQAQQHSAQVHEEAVSAVHLRQQRRQMRRPNFRFS